MRGQADFIRLLRKARGILLSDRNDKLCKAVERHTLLSQGKLRNLRRLATFLSLNSIEGDFVECGTYKGGSAAVIGESLSPDRHLWLYDSFEGLPAASDIDGEDAKKCEGTCVGHEEGVTNILTSVGISDAQYTIVRGWFKDTFGARLPRKVALLHCDADWYDSVLLVLETFYPLVQEGGCVILDDFGCWEGCREAFYDFCCKYGEKPLIERLEYDQAYWIKGKKHNRGGQVVSSLA